MKTRLLSILCILLMSLDIQAQNTEFETAAEAVKNMKIGWNLVNTLDSHTGGDDWGLKTPQDWETCWGNPVTKPELLKMIRKAGFGTMRIPVTWYPHTDSQGNIDAEWMKRVHEVVDYVIDQGMYCILNTHHETGFCYDGDTDVMTYPAKLIANADNYHENKEWFENVWRQIANEFKDYDQHLLFEGYNEMTDETDGFCFPSDKFDETHVQEAYQAINDYAQSFVNAVRSTGDNNLERNLIVNPYSACVGPVEEDWCRRPYMELKIPNDVTENHIIFGIHCYWMDNEDDARGIINNVNKCFTSRGVPTIISEYGTGMDNLDIALTKQASKNGVAPIIWNHDFCDGNFRRFPAFDDKDKVKAALKAFYGDWYEPSLLTKDDYNSRNVKVVFKQYDAELGLLKNSDPSYDSDKCMGIKLFLKEKPEQGRLQINVWYEKGGLSSEINSETTTIIFDKSRLGENKNSPLVTLQSKYSGSCIVEIDSIMLLFNGEPYAEEVFVWNHHDCDVNFLRNQFVHTVEFGYLWAELNIFADDVPLKLKNYKGMRLELAEMPKDVRVKVYGDGEQKEDNIGIADASSTILFNTDIFSNEINRVTLQYTKDGKGEAKVISAWLIRQDGTEEYSDLSPFHGCEITKVEKYVPIIITANNLTMTYGDEVPELTFTTKGGTLNGTPKLMTSATKTSPVGTYPIKVEKGTVTNGAVTYVDGTLTITQAPLTVGVQNVTITEGDAIPPFTLTYSGLKNDDTEANAFSKKPTATTTATVSSMPGTYPISVSGGESTNYTLNYQSGTLTILEDENPASYRIYPLTLDIFHEWDGCTATSKVVKEDCGGEIHVDESLGAGSMVYGDVSVFYTRYADVTKYDQLLIEGKPGMEFRLLLNRLEVGNGGGDDHGGSWTELNPVIGTDGKAIVDLPDFEFVHLNAIKTGWGSPEGVIKGLYLVKGRKEQPVTITANDLTMVYGDDVPKLTYTTEGEALNGTPKLSTTATKKSPVGTYPIKVEKGTVTNEQVTYVDGTLTITQAPLTVGVQDVTIIEGDAIPSFTLTYNVFKNDDTESNAFTKKPTVKTTATSSSKAGTYPITVSGGEAKNYALTYTQGTLTIQKKPVEPVTITADDKRMVYGNDVPTLTYKSSGAKLNGTPKLSTTATKTSPVGTYPIKVEKGTVTNEQVTYVDGTLTIEKAPLTVGVEDMTITEGDAIPAFNLTYSGFRNGDTESNAFTKKPTAKTTATSSSKAGTYPITVNGGEAKNYALTYTQGTLTIKEKEQGSIVDGAYPLTIDMFHEWDGCTATSKVVNEDCGGEIHVGEKLGAGNLVYGGVSVFYTQYADLTGYDVLAIVGTPGMEFRVLLNRLEVGNGGGDDHGGSWTELNPAIGEDGKAIIDLSNYDFVHLNAIKTGWGCPEGIVEKLLIVKGKDNPLGINNINDVIRNQYSIFNLSGQRMASPRKGINIINGKKVVVK